MGRRKSISDQQLLNVARDVFVAKGIGASTREIARRADISESVLFQRYATKADLFFAAMAPPDVDLRRMLEADDAGADPLRSLEQIASRMLDYFRQLMPILLPLATHPAFDYEAFVKRYPDSPLSLIREGVIARLTRFADAGVIRRDAVPGAGLTLVATMHSLAMFERLGAHGGRFDESLLKAVVHSLWHGLKA